VIVLTIAGAFVPTPDGGAMLTRLPDKLIDAPAALAPTFLALDFKYLAAHLGQTLPLILAFLFVDLFDNMGTLIGVCQRLGLLDAQGRLPGIGRALTADAGAAMEKPVDGLA
jgi:AGZA family xanthine/uracil permease-like MFS transporter